MIRNSLFVKMYVLDSDLEQFDFFLLVNEFGLIIPLLFLEDGLLFLQYGLKPTQFHFIELNLS